jgi:hypothetical protein
MNIVPEDNLLSLINLSWAEWLERGSGNPNWESVCEKLAEIVGCKPEHFLVKVVRQGNVTVRLNEALLSHGVIYPVLVCDSSVDLTSSQLRNGPRAQISSGANEGVLIFVETTSGQFSPFRVTALENSPIHSKISSCWPAIEVDLISNPTSVRFSLSQVAKHQENYVAKSDDPGMLQRAKDLSAAALSLEAGLNRNPTQTPIRVKANSGIGLPAKVPYLRIFSKEASPNASTGFYVCAFVSADGENLVLSVQQPATSGSSTDFKSLGREELEQNSIKFQNVVRENLDLVDILEDFGSTRAPVLGNSQQQPSATTRGYSESDVVSRSFKVDDLPSDTELTQLVRKLFGVAEFLNKEYPSISVDPTEIEGSIATKINWNEERVNAVLGSLLDSSPQVVLAGPPGTGKSFVSRWIASAVLGIPGQINNERINFVQFHPTYGYEDFVEGLRPILENGNVVFQNVPGPILRIAKQIMEDGQAQVLIIDEINRANIARVFGELMYLLEYRDQQIDLMLHEKFRLPGKLYIIATMNTADKSTRVMDAALRRRFDFFQIEPDVEVLRKHYETVGNVNHLGEELFSGFEKLNKRLMEDLDQHRLVGHSYFMADTFNVSNLKARWERQISPLLSEYFYERQAQAEKYSIEEFWPSAES